MHGKNSELSKVGGNHPVVAVAVHHDVDVEDAAGAVAGVGELRNEVLPKAEAGHFGRGNLILAEALHPHLQDPAVKELVQRAAHLADVDSVLDDLVVQILDQGGLAELELGVLGEELKNPKSEISKIKKSQLFF